METRQNPKRDEGCIVSESTFVCAKCGKEIIAGERYFWGRHGGEWHPVCFKEVEDGGGAVVGMWKNDPEEITAFQKQYGHKEDK